MRPGCLPKKVGIERANYDAGVFRLCGMESQKVPPVDGQYTPALRRGESQHLVIRPALPRLAGFEHRQYVVTEATQFLHNRQREALVRVEACHDLSIFISPNLLVDFLAMQTHVGPGVGKVFCAKRGIGAQEFRFAHAKAAGLLQPPYGNPGTDNTWLAAADAGSALNSRKGSGFRDLHDQFYPLSRGQVQRLVGV